MASVFANGRSIVHKGDGQINTAAPPDACKTPSPGGPVPIPYVNIARTSDLAKGTKKVKIEGNPAGNAGSNLSTSMGDEAGTAGGGLLSSKTKGKLTWATKSANVKLEGKGAVRFMDVAQHNGNSFNTVFIEKGGTGLAYGDDYEGPCPICRESPEKHVILETKSIAEACAKVIKKLIKAKYPNGFMVGLALCGHCNQTILATSGSTPEDFASAVSGAADIILLDGPIKDPADFVHANSMLKNPANMAKLRKAWDRLKSSFKEQDKDGPYTRPGRCAAQKIVKSGHKPVAMTEMMYSPPRFDRWRKWYQLKSILGGVKSKVWTIQSAAGVFNEPRGVASCQTCQELLPMLLCDKKRSC